MLYILTYAVQTLIFAPSGAITQRLKRLPNKPLPTFSLYIQTQE